MPESKKLPLTREAEIEAAYAQLVALAARGTSRGNSNKRRRRQRDLEMLRRLEAGETLSADEMRWAERAKKDLRRGPKPIRKD